MRNILKLISFLALIGVILPSVLFLAGKIGLDDVYRYTLIATAVWFLTTPFWMDRKT